MEAALPGFNPSAARQWQQHHKKNLNQNQQKDEDHHRIQARMHRKRSRAWAAWKELSCKHQGEDRGKRCSKAAAVACSIDRPPVQRCYRNLSSRMAQFESALSSTADNNETVHWRSNVEGSIQSLIHRAADAHLHCRSMQASLDAMEAQLIASPSLLQTEIAKNSQLRDEIEEELEAIWERASTGAERLRIAMGSAEIAWLRQLDDSAGRLLASTSRCLAASASSALE